MRYNIKGYTVPTLGNQLSSELKFSTVMLLVVLSCVTAELRGEPNDVTASFERSNRSGSGGGGKGQQTPESDSAQRHYQAGLVALEKNDLAAAEEEMQKAVNLAPKNALYLKLADSIETQRVATCNKESARLVGHGF